MSTGPIEWDKGRPVSPIHLGSEASSASPKNHEDSAYRIKLHESAQYP